MIYIFRDQDRIQTSRSVLPEGDMVGSFPGGIEDEYYFHQRFGQNKIDQEWFYISSEMAEYFNVSDSAQPGEPKKRGWFMRFWHWFWNLDIDFSKGAVSGFKEKLDRIDQSLGLSPAPPNTNCQHDSRPCFGGCERTPEIYVNRNHANESSQDFNYLDHNPQAGFNFFDREASEYEPVSARPNDELSSFPPDTEFDTYIPEFNPEPPDTGKY